MFHAFNLFLNEGGKHSEATPQERFARLVQHVNRQRAQILELQLNQIGLQTALFAAFSALGEANPETFSTTKKNLSKILENLENSGCRNPEFESFLKMLIDVKLDEFLSVLQQLLKRDPIDERPNDDDLFQ
jgi:hypothetical protein